MILFQNERIKTEIMDKEYNIFDFKPCFRFFLWLLWKKGDV